MTIPGAELLGNTIFPHFLTQKRADEFFFLKEKSWSHFLSALSEITHPEMSHHLFIEAKDAGISPAMFFCLSVC